MNALSAVIAKWPGFRLVRFDHSLVPFPWFSQARLKDDTARLRRTVLDQETAGLPAGSALERALAAVIYGGVSLRQTLSVWRQEAPAARRKYGIGLLRQLKDLLYYAWALNIHPSVYYFQGHYRPERNGYGKWVIPHIELQSLLRLMEDPGESKILDDKLEFFLFCQKNDLPTVPVIAAFGNGHQIPLTTEEGIEDDLFVKPTEGYSSQGLMLWRWDENRRSYENDGERLDWEGFVSKMREASRGTPLLVQPRIRNHESIARLSSEALANCRIVTARHPSGKIETIMAVFRMGTGDSITCDVPTQTFCASIIPGTGALAAPGTKSPRYGGGKSHPDSGEMVEGKILEAWPEMERCAHAAHQKFEKTAFVGWDLVHSDRGVLLLEGNIVWAGNLAQMGEALPLGLTCFPEIAMAKLNG